MTERTPRGELLATNPNATNKAVVNMPACSPVGDDAIGKVLKLLADLTAELYGSVAAARTAERKGDDVDYRLETILSSCGIAATEAEAIFVLGSGRRFRTAQIHIRALGEIARRCIVLFNEPEFAKALFASLQHSRKSMVEKVPAGHPVREFTLRFLPKQKAPTMRTLESDAKALFKKHDEPQTVSAYELEAWSKWQHGDIVALADAAEMIRDSGEDLQDALNGSHNGDVVALIHRACGFVLTLLYVLSWFGVQDQKLDEYVQRFASFTPAIAEQITALRNALAIIENAIAADANKKAN